MFFKDRKLHILTCTHTWYSPVPIKHFFTPTFLLFCTFDAFGNLIDNWDLNFLPQLGNKFKHHETEIDPLLWFKPFQSCLLYWSPRQCCCSSKVNQLNKLWFQPKFSMILCLFNNMSFKTLAGYFLQGQKWTRSYGFSMLRHNIEIPNGENSRIWVSNVVLKFHNDPTVKESEIVVFLRQVRWPAGKREGFGRREKKQHCETEECYIEVLNKEGD